MTDGYRTFMGVAMGASLGLLGWLLLQMLSIHDAVINLHNDFGQSERDVMRDEGRLDALEQRVHTLELRR